MNTGRVLSVDVLPTLMPSKAQLAAHQSHTRPPATFPWQLMMAPPKTLAVAAALAAVVGVAVLLPATYKVGDDAGWDVGVDYDAWARGKKFKVGDTLVFRYSHGEKDVVPVDARGYAECAATGDARALTSGNDHVALGKAGHFFFICDAEGECDSGMKLAVTVQ